MRTRALLACLPLLALSAPAAPRAVPPADFASAAHQRPPALTDLWPLVDGAVWHLRAPGGGSGMTSIRWSRWTAPWGCGATQHDLWLSTWTKTDPGIYWWPGMDATLFMLFYVDSAGVIRSPGYWTDIAGQLRTSQFLQIGNEAPYPGMVESYGGPLAISAPYAGRGADGWTSACLPPSAATYQRVDWTLRVTRGWIDLPIYSGPVAISDVQELDCPHCNHEVWTFAPHLGVVKIDQLATANNPTENILVRVP